MEWGLYVLMKKIYQLPGSLLPFDNPSISPIESWLLRPLANLVQGFSNNLVTPEGSRPPITWGGHALSASIPNPHFTSSI